MDAASQNHFGQMLASTDTAARLQLELPLNCRDEDFTQKPPGASSNFLTALIGITH
jgi:hypothetical protein